MTAAKTTDEELLARVARLEQQLAAAQRAAAIAASAAKDHYIHFFRLSPDPMCIADPFGCFKHVNPAFVRLTGFDEAELVSRPFLELVLPEDRERTAREAELLVGVRPTMHFENRYVCKDGSVVPLMWTAFYDRVDGVAYATATDVSERRRAEKELSRFRLGIDRSNDAIFLTRPDGTINYVNDAFERLYGFTAVEAIGKTPRILKSGTLDAPAYERLWKTLLSKEVVKGEYTNKAKDGTLIPVEASAAPIVDEDGELAGFLAIHRDVSDRKRAELERERLQEQLRQSQKMEAIGLLAGGVAHDFNNLLSVILSYSELAAGSLHAADPMRADLEEISAAGKRAADLTRQLLAFSRKQVLEPKIVDLAGVVAGIEKMLRRLLGEDIELTVTMRSPLGKVLVDPGQIEQVMMNLAANARDAMPHGGKLTIEGTEVELDEAYGADHVGVAPGPYIMMAVTDTGIGMDRATQARIFEPFFTTKEVGRGTGLGLATVYGIVKQSGGSIQVYSEPGQGTTFRLYFPRSDNAASVPTTSAPGLHPTFEGKETILLVEDEERVRALVHSILRRYGYNVLEAQSGGDALLVCEQHPATIHLLLTDVVMPRMSGRQLAERLKSVRPEMKVLYMSGYANDAIVRHGILNSTVALLQKPILPEPLVRKVREVLDAL